MGYERHGLRGTVHSSFWTVKSCQTPVRLELIGLRARYSLRLEAGMSLYGNDLDEIRTTVE